MAGECSKVGGYLLCQDVARAQASVTGWDVSSDSAVHLSSVVGSVVERVYWKVLPP